MYSWNHLAFTRYQDPISFKFICTQYSDKKHKSSSRKWQEQGETNVVVLNVAEVIYMYVHVLLYMKVQSCTCNIKGRLNSFEFWILKCLFLHVDFSGESASLCTSQVCAKHPHWWIWWYISPWERKGNTILIIFKK